MADINLQIAEALSRGLGPQDILKGLSESDNPEHRAWIANYKTNLVAQDQGVAAPAAMPAGPDISGVQALGSVANKMAGAYAELPTSAQLAIPAAVAGGAYIGGKAVNLGFNTLQDKLKAAQEVKTQAALNALPPSAAVQVQQQQLALQQADQANRFAQQAQQGIGSPAVDPLVEARVATETQRAATESARTEAAKHQAALAQQKLINQQKKAEIIKVNPAAQAAAAEALPVEAQPVAPAKPTIADLQQKLGVIPGGAAPANVIPAPVVPTAVDVVTPPVDAAITADPVATPIEKAQALVHAPEAPVAAPIAPAAVAPPPGRTGPLTTASGFPAQEGTGPAKQRIPSEVESMAKIPKGMAFVPGMNLGGTNTARNALGTEGAIAFAQQRGVPFGPHSETEQVLKDFNAQRVGPPATRELRKAIGAPMPSNTPALAGKVMKVGGVLGTLMAVSDLASAKSLPEAAAIGGNIAAGALPLPLQALTYMKGAGEGENAQMDYLRRMQAAKERGAGNRGVAYDPRIPYNPQFMDVGIPPPFNR